MTPVIHNFSWQEVSDICHNLYKKIKADKFQPDVIITPQRGGFVPTAILSHLIGCREVIVVDIKRTLSDEIHSKKISPTLSGNISSKNVLNKKILIIDDILGSGETLIFLMNKIKELGPTDLRSAIVVQNNENFEKSSLFGKLKPDYLGKNVRGWVIFPWEK